MDRAELDLRLQKLRAHLPRILADAENDGNFWPAFAGEADVIEDGASNAEDCRHVRDELNQMLQQAGVSEQ